MERYTLVLMKRGDWLSWRITALWFAVAYLGLAIAIGLAVVIPLCFIVGGITWFMTRKRS